jgi:uncharacterized protein (TIGR03066 family)
VKCACRGTAMPDDFQAEPPRRSSIPPSAYDRFTAVNFRKQENGTSTRLWARVIAFVVGGGLVTFFLGMIWQQETATPALKVRTSEFSERQKKLDTGDKVVIRAEHRAAEEKKEPSNKEKLIGTWEVTKSADAPAGTTIEFTKDGKFKVTAKVDGKEGGYERTYTVDEDTINFGGDGDPKTAMIKKLTETILVLDYGDGATDELKRYKK